MDQMDQMGRIYSLEFEIISCIQNARKQRFVVQNFIHSSNQHVIPQRISWQPVAGVSSPGIGNVTVSSSSLGYLHADIGSPEYNKHSVNYGRH